MGFENVHEYRAGKVDWLAAGLPTEGDNPTRPRAGDAARKDVPVCGLTDSLKDVRERAKAAGWEVAVVVDDRRVVLGLLRAKELDKDPSLSAAEAMRPAPSTFRPYVSIKEMADYMAEHDLESSPVTTSDGRLVGVILKSDAADLAAGCPDCVRKLI